MNNTLRVTALYSRIREILDSARANVARSVNTTQVVSNWLVGREIVEEQQSGEKRAAYGKRLLADLSMRLQADYGKGFSIQNLEHFRDFFLTYAELLGPQIPHALRAESSLESRNLVSIPHALRGEFTPLTDIEKSDAARRILSVAGSLLSDVPCCQSWQLGRRHANLSWTHYRTLLRVDNAEARAFYEIEAIDNNWAARELERQINSLLIDLVFYHTILKCFVLIDLKTGKLTHEDLGQLQLYVNFYDRERRTAGDNPTLGLILCTDKNDAVVKYTLGPEQSRKIFASRYKLYLPSEEELRAEIRREVQRLPSRKPAGPTRRKAKQP